MLIPQVPSAASRVLSVDAIRAEFPALLRQHAGRPVAYFDGPGGTQVPRAVVEAMSDYLFHHNANTHWAYPTSVETDEVIEYARRAMADFLNASPEEVAFGANMTTLTFHLARALARQWREGDEIIVTDLDHHANIDPWRAVASERGLVVRSVPVNPDTCTLNWPALERAFSPRTRLLAVGAASNAVGTINDVGAAATIAHAAGALVFVDAVHYAPHVLVDVGALDCDFLALSAYKFYGPHLGALYGRRALIESLQVPKLAPAPDGAPDRLETGTQNHEGIAGTAAAVEFLASLAAAPDATRRERLAASFAALHARGCALTERLWTGLRAIPRVTVHGPSPDLPRTPTVSFTVAGRASDDVARALVEQSVFASSGDFYASTLVGALGHARDGLVRLGCACYTTADEVERVLQAIDDIARR